MTPPSYAGSSGDLAGQAEHPLAEDVAQDLHRPAHDHVAGGVADVAGDPAAEPLVGEGRVGAEHPAAELGDPDLELGAEGLGGRREPRRRLLQGLTKHEQAADAVDRKRTRLNYSN